MELWGQRVGHSCYRFRSQIRKYQILGSSFCIDKIHFISDDGRNINNIKARVSKGKGIMCKILTYLDGIPFGKFYFEIALILRNSLMLSSILFNSEAWYNISKAELDLIESVDLMFLRSILKTPNSTTKEMLYLELGCMPCRDIKDKKDYYIFTIF